MLAGSLLHALDDVDPEIGLDHAGLADLEPQRQVLERRHELRGRRDVVGLAVLRRARIFRQLRHQRLNLRAALQLRDGVLDQLLERRAIAGQRAPDPSR